MNRARLGRLPFFSIGMLAARSSFTTFWRLKGLQALADSGRLQAFAQPRLTLLLTEIVVFSVLILADLKIIQPALRVPSLGDDVLELRSTLPNVSFF